MSKMEDAVQYDRQGRMKYHPDFHDHYKKNYTTKEHIYMCKQYRRGNVKTLALALGRTEASVRMEVYKLRKLGLFEEYRKMED